MNSSGLCAPHPRRAHGQVATYNADIICQVYHRQIVRHAPGTDALEFAETLALIAEREHEYPCSYLRRAMTGHDSVLWELRGRLEGRPVVELLCGTPGPCAPMPVR